MTIINIKTRNDIPRFLEQNDYKGQGVEVGVQYGWFSLHVVNNWNSCDRFYGVDVWKNLPNYVDACNVHDDLQTRVYFEAQYRLLDTKARLIRATSLEAAKEFKRRGVFFDFVYIDADHSYSTTYSDLQHWFPLVRPGGIFAGHDYMDCQTAQGDYGVKSAVLDFFKNEAHSKGKPVIKDNFIHITQEQEPETKSWIVEKMG